MEWNNMKDLITANVGAILAASIPLATVVFQKRLTNKAHAASEEDGAAEPVARKPRGSSFHKAESFMELRTNGSGGASESQQQGWVSLGLEQPLVIAMVGLPARGKSYIVNMIIRYLKWIGFEAQVFNVGSHRRKKGLQSADSNFFNADNEEGKRMREQLAMEVQDSMYEWLHGSKDFTRRVAIFDATNTTINRRQSLAQRAREHRVELLFVESICNDQEVLKQNYDLKLQNEDYKGMDPEKARSDFMSRVRAYEKVYETIEDYEDNYQISYLKLINVGQKVITRNCHGYLPSQVAFYLQNVHITPRKIYLSVNAQAVNVSDLVGGMQSGALTESGLEYSEALADYLQLEQQADMQTTGKEILVLTGTTILHSESTEALKNRGFRVFPTPVLNELRGGDFHGLTKAQFESQHPEEFAKRAADKLNYRYPGAAGESYMDVIERVRPVIIELERQRRSIVIVCHLAVLRCIYAYFMGIPVSELPFKDLRMHHIYELSPGPFGCHCVVVDPTRDET